MKSLMAFSASAALAAAPMIAIPHLALAYTTSWDYDPCKEAQKSATTRGAVTGGVLGAVVGSAVAGGDSRLGGALVGGAVGAASASPIRPTITPAPTAIGCRNTPAAAPTASRSAADQMESGARAEDDRTGGRMDRT